MILHVLPGDAVVEKFKATKIEGEIAVCREALIDGDVSGETLPEFWENRARFHSLESQKGEDDYHETVVREFAKLTALQSGSAINLWFEYELFCQVNMWFCLSLLDGSTADIFRVEPVVALDREIWDGFGNLSPEDLRKCFEARVRLSPDDVDLGAKLWSAYKERDHSELARLSTSKSPAFPMLQKVCDAEIEKEFRPKEIIREVAEGAGSNFDEVFRAFKARAGVYGYGDTQVKKIWQSLRV